jgi:hypothetical protein
MGLGSGE